MRFLVEDHDSRPRCSTFRQSLMSIFVEYGRDQAVSFIQASIQILMKLHTTENPDETDGCLTKLVNSHLAQTQDPRTAHVSGTRRKAILA